MVNIKDKNIEDVLRVNTHEHKRVFKYKQQEHLAFVKRENGNVDDLLSTSEQSIEDALSIKHNHVEDFFRINKKNGLDLPKVGISMLLFFRA